MSIVNNIRKCISESWDYENISDETLAVCFHSQKVLDGFQLYFNGYEDFYPDHDTWLLNETFEPKINFINLGIESSLLNELDFFNIHKIEVEQYLKNNIERFNTNVKYFCIQFPGGKSELLFVR